MARLRLVFMGTADLACASLAALADNSEFEVVAVVTQPDRPKGRELKPQPPAVKVLARARNIPVLQPERARNESFIQELQALHPDLIVVAAYGQILPKAILDLPPHGCLNVHTSILPRYRGAAPIQWAILEGEPETGVTIMKMDVGLDTGDIISVEKTPIHDEDTGQTLHDRLANIGASLLVKTIPSYVSGQLKPQAQPKEGATYARKITKEDGKVDWTLPAKGIWNRVRALTPWPGAYTYQHTPGPKLLKISGVEPASGQGAPGTVISAGADGVIVACGEAALRIRTLQREGGKRLPAADFLRGNPLHAGDKLG